MGDRACAVDGDAWERHSCGIHHSATDRARMRSIDSMLAAKPPPREPADLVVVISEEIVVISWNYFLFGRYRLLMEP